MIIAEDLSLLVGNTPLFLLRKQNVNYFLKLEMWNPGLSIKDRVAFHITKTEIAHSLPKGSNIVEYSSGNLGIGLSLAGLCYGYNVNLIVTDKTSQEKLSLLRNLGAQVIVTREEEISTDPLGMVGVAKYINENLPNSYFVNQFFNPKNPETHYKWTGPEIWKQLNGNVDYFFSAMGTGGTVTGVGSFLKKEKTDVKIIGVTPKFGIYFTCFHGLPDNERAPAGDTIIEGVAEDFIPETLELAILDDLVEIDDKIAFLTLEEIAKKGLFLGGSSGLAIAAALNYNFETNKDINVVIMCPDSGNRYLSTLYNREFQSKKLSVDSKKYSTNTRLKELISKISEGKYPYVID